MIPSYTPGQKVLVYKPHQSTDGSNQKAYPAMARAVHSMFQIVTGFVSNPTPGRHETSVCTFDHGHKVLQTPSIGSGTRLSQTRRVIPRKDFAYSCLEESETIPPHIGIYQVADVVSHRRGQGERSLHNYMYRLRLKGFDPEADLEYRAHHVRQCQDLTYCSIPRLTPT